MRKTIHTIKIPEEYYPQVGGLIIQIIARFDRDPTPEEMPFVDAHMKKELSAIKKVPRGITYGPRKGARQYYSTNYGRSSKIFKEG